MQISSAWIFEDLGRIEKKKVRSMKKEVSVSSLVQRQLLLLQFLRLRASRLG
jgi:hypothetical protein